MKNLDAARHLAYSNLVDQTAQFRFCVRWEGGRALMAARGFAADRIMMCSCDQGNDVHVVLVLSNKMHLNCHFKEGLKTRQMVSISSWEESPVTSNDDDVLLAREIFASDYLKECFDRAVKAYFDFHFKPDDRPLPPRI